MNEASERVLVKFATLLKNNPNGNVPFLWVQAGGKVASQQSVHLTGLCVCPEEWSVDIHGNCSNCGLSKSPRK